MPGLKTAVATARADLLICVEEVTALNELVDDYYEQFEAIFANAVRMMAIMQSVFFSGSSA